MWRFSRILKKISQIQKNDTSEVLNPSQPHVAFLYPLKTSENLQIFCFQGVQKSNTGLFLVTLFRVVFFLALVYLTVVNLARLGISVCCLVSVRSQYFARLLSQCWIIDGHKIHPPIDDFLPPTGIELTPFRNSASKVAGLQVHVNTPSNYKCMPLHPTVMG